MTSSNGNIFRVIGNFAGNSPVGEFPAQRPVTRRFDVFFDLRLNKRFSKQPWGWWFETPSWSLWRQCNDITHYCTQYIFEVRTSTSNSRTTPIARCVKHSFSEIKMKTETFPFRQNAFESVVCNMAAILFSSRCVNCPRSQAESTSVHFEGSPFEFSLTKLHL